MQLLEAALPRLAFQSRHSRIADGRAAASASQKIREVAKREPEAQALGLQAWDICIHGGPMLRRTGGEILASGGDSASLPQLMHSTVISACIQI